MRLHAEFNEDTNTLSVQLKPIFEHLRQLKLKDKKDFSENLFTLTRTLKTRSESAKQALENDRLEISKKCMTGTRTIPINTILESSYENSKKVISEKGLLSDYSGT